MTEAALNLDLEQLRQAIQGEYAEVALRPEQGFHFHTGRPLAALLGYQEEWLEGIPEPAIASLAGTGNPFSLGEIRPSWPIPNPFALASATGGTKLWPSPRWAARRSAGTLCTRSPRRFRG